MPFFFALTFEGAAGAESDAPTDMSVGAAVVGIADAVVRGVGAAVCVAGEALADAVGCAAAVSVGAGVYVTGFSTSSSVMVTKANGLVIILITMSVDQMKGIIGRNILNPVIIEVIKAFA